MKAIITLDVVPESGLHVVREEKATRLFFDFTPHHLPDEDSENQYVCENVDVEGRVTYDTVVSAIIKDRYSSDKRDAILSNYEMSKDATSDLTQEKRDEYLQEYTDFQNLRKKAKLIASKL